MENSDAPPDKRPRGAELPPYPGTPRWVYGFGLILIVPILVFLIRHLTAGGLHGHGS